MASLSLLFALFLFIQQGDLYKLPNVSNGTDSGPNLKIVHGEIGNHNQFPYQVSIADQENTNHFCGGVILSEYYVLTATHCIVEDNGDRKQAGDLTVRVGLDSLDETEIFSRSFSVEQIWTHPDYTPWWHDVAILKLGVPIQFGNGVDRACFDLSYNTQDYYIVSGFGDRMTSQGKDRNPTPERLGKELKYAYAREDRNAGFCQDSDAFICLVPYYEGSGDSSCFGDSGGPLSTPDYKVVGTFSVVYANSDNTFCIGHSEYTRTVYHRDYINSIIGENGWCHN